MKEKLTGWLGSSWQWLKKRWWLAAVALGVGLLVWLSSREQPVPVELATVESGQVREFLLEEAKTRLDEEFLLTLPVAGEVPRLQLEVGDWVKAGDSLLTMRRFARGQELAGLQAQVRELQARDRGVNTQMPTPEDLSTAQNQIATARHQLAQAETSKAATEVELATAEKQLQRHQSLTREGALPPSQLDETHKQVALLQKRVQQDFLNLQAARESLQNAQLAAQKLQRQRKDQGYLHAVYDAQSSQLASQIALKQDELRKGRLIAPISGPVLEVFTPHAGVYPAGTQMLKLGDPGSLQVETDLLSEDIYRVKVGMRAEISGKALQDRILTGQVSRIYPSGFTKISALGVEQQRIKVMISLPATARTQLRPGTRVDARIITAAKAQTLRIPERALFKQDNQWQVFKLVAGRLQLQPVSIGLKNEDWAEISQGLHAGDQVVSKLENQLKPNLLVTPLVEASGE